jgi:histidyl-tRNA synthetase
MNRVGEKKTGNPKRVKPELPGGFLDYGPQEAMLKQRLLECARRTFENFGFEPMETPAVERTKVLLGGEEESGKIIFNVSSSRASEFKEKDKLSLRFDLTVPLARFIAANPEIPKPFKRYQIGQVFRGESPQAGRYREFTQADIDIVGTGSLEADIEIIAAIAAFFKSIGVGSYCVEINNRKILNALPAYAAFPHKKLPEVLRILDKKNKKGEEETGKEILKMLGKESGGKVRSFTSLSGAAEEKISGAGKLFGGNPTAEEGIQELSSLVSGLDALGLDRKNWEIDFSMVRGLGYYTGPIFETILTEAPELGSMFSGGRYDNLVAAFTGEKLSAVGASLGVDRLFAGLAGLDLFEKKTNAVKVLILNLSPKLRNDYFQIAEMLRAENLAPDLYLGDDRSFRAQLAYAVKKEIPYVLMYGENEEKKGVVAIKNLSTREQKEISKNTIREYFARRLPAAAAAASFPHVSP